MGIKNLPQNERPREKAITYGIDKLSNAELLAIILRTGTKANQLSALGLSQKILDQVGGLNGLKAVDINQLMQIDGIKMAKATDILATVELSRRLVAESGDYLEVIDTPEIVCQKLAYLQEANQEHFVVLFLNQHKQLLKQKTMFIGTRVLAPIGIYEIMREALLCNATLITCVHNHPSGNLIPSSYDYEVTDELLNATLSMQMELYDHIIISRKGYVSLRAKGFI